MTTDLAEGAAAVDDAGAGTRVGVGVGSEDCGGTGGAPLQAVNTNAAVTNAALRR